MKIDKTKRLSPSLLAADFYNLEGDLNKLEQADQDCWLHLDIMDGHFVPNITFGPDQVRRLKEHVNLPFDVHLMISHPVKYIPEFIKAGADLISVHVETIDKLDICFDMLDEAGVKKGLVVSPDTMIEVVEPWLDRVDLVLIMSVYPGFGGQKYIPSADEKIRKLKELIGDRNIVIEVDGGINQDTIDEAIEAGADVFVAGTAVFRGDIKENIEKLKSSFKES